MITIGIMIFPQVEELDFIGPFEVVSQVNKKIPDSTQVLIVAESLEPLQAYNGLKVIPDATFSSCPQLDVLIVPGGKGRLAAMQNESVKNFIVNQAATAQYITSVCTGSLVLAAAGLLTGKRATTYHTAFEELASYSVEVLSQKVVQDGNIITAGGVSSGIELGCYLLKILFGLDLAQTVADSIEYQIDVSKL